MVRKCVRKQPRKAASNMKVLFIPDLFKYEEEFIIEAANIEEVINKLCEEFPYNCLLAAYIVSKHGFIYLGVLKVDENQSPKWVESELDDLESDGE